MMTEEKFKEIFDTYKSDIMGVGDNALEGLLTIQKYVPYVLRSAEHDKIYSVSVEDLCARNITEEDVIRLRTLNWGIEYDSLYCFV